MTNITKNKKINKTILIFTLAGELLGILLLSIMMGPDMSRIGKAIAFLIAVDAVIKGLELLKLIYRD